LLFYSTFVTGLQEPIAEWVGEEGHRVRQVLDGAIMYDARENAKNKSPLPCFFNTFAVIDHEKRPVSVENMMRKVLQKPGKFRRGRGTFRIVTSRENQLISVDAHLRNNMEKLIAAKTGLKSERRGGGHEFWFLSRSEGVTLFMERQPVGVSDRLRKGELRPQLAYCLNRLAQPGAGDVMADPFCGYGGITKARALHFPCKEIHGLDAAPIDKKSRKADISQLSTIFQAQSVDVIVTDPPWGNFKDSGNLSEIYAQLAEGCRRVLKTGGRAVVLSAQKELMRSEIWDWARLEACYDILVSGHKAGIFVYNRG